MSPQGMSISTHAITTVSFIVVKSALQILKAKGIFRLNITKAPVP